MWKLIAAAAMVARIASPLPVCALGPCSSGSVMASAPASTRALASVLPQQVLLGLVRHVTREDPQPPLPPRCAKRGHKSHWQEFGVAMLEVSAAVCYANAPPVTLVLAKHS